MADESPQQQSQQPERKQSDFDPRQQQQQRQTTAADLNLDFGHEPSIDDSPSVSDTPVAPQPVPLYQRSGTAVSLLLEPADPVALHVDGVVITCTPEGTPTISSAVLEATLGSSGANALYSDLPSRTQSAWGKRGRAKTAVHVPAPAQTELDPAQWTALPADPPQPSPTAHLLAITPFAPDPDKPEVMRPNKAAAARATAAAVKLAAQVGVRRLALPIWVDAEMVSSGTAVAAVMLRAINNSLPLLPTNPLQEIVLVTADSEVSAGLRALVVEKPSPTPNNDLPTGRDLLNVQTEAYALAEMLMLRELEPPLCVGVLGGWGSGKSFFMHLMQQKMNELRSRALRPEETWQASGAEDENLSEFVGHVYQISFNAWTYAKSDLWASLMQTVFSELNRQLTLEKRLAQLENASLGPLSGGRVWLALNQMPPDAQEALLTAELGVEAMRELNSDAVNNATADSLWSALEQVRRAEREALRKTEQEINRLEQNLAQKTAAIERNVDEAIEREAAAVVWQPLRARLAVLLGMAETEVTAMVNARMPEAPQGDGDRTHFVMEVMQPETADSLRWLWSRRGERSLLLAFVFFLALAAVLPFLLAAIGELGSAMREMAPFSMLPPLLPAAAFGGQLWRRVQDWQTQFNRLRAVYQQEVETRVNELADSRQARIAAAIEAEQQTLETQMQQPGAIAAGVVQKLADAQNVAAMRRRKAQLAARADRQRERIGLTADFVSVADFVSSRLQSETYQPRLGLMQQVQADLDELSNGLTIHAQDVHTAAKQALFPRGPARIVLFIDDLDRCPPDRVVEMFEAAQLLLKTKLFVVVLALDVRYVSRALEKHYDGILARRGDPSGLDYIEKIIQIPYRIRPIDEDALPGYLDMQMDRLRVETAVTPTPATGAASAPSAAGLEAGKTDEETDAETPASAIITFNDTESALIHACCGAVELTPRAIKRMINVFKLIKLVWNRSLQGNQSDEVVAAVALLLALSARYPELMRGVFTHIRNGFRRNPNDTLAYLLQNYQLPPNEAYLQAEYEAWRGSVESIGQLSPLPQHAALRIGDIPLQELSVGTFNLVRSLCFVGDVGYDAAERTRLTALQTTPS